MWLWLHQCIAMLELLYSLIMTFTGLDRTVDPVLESHAQVRVIQIQSDFSHSIVPVGWGEVLAWDEGSLEPVEPVVQGWRSSPSHWTILSDPDYMRIGCAVASEQGKTWFACLLAVPMYLPETPVPSPDILSEVSPLTMSNTSVSSEAESNGAN